MHHIELNPNLPTSPALPAQEDFGGMIVGTHTNDALTHYIEARNAAMAPLLDVHGMAALYREDAVLVHPLDGMPESRIVGRRAIEIYFGRIATIMRSMTLVETRRTVTGRRAVWEGRVEGAQAGTRLRLGIPVVLSLDFDEDDLVAFHHGYYSVDEARRQLGDFKLG